MYKFLRTVAPAILVIFMSTSVISPAFGANDSSNKPDKVNDIQIEMFLYSYDLVIKNVIAAIDKPATGETIKMELKVQGKGSQVTDVKLLANPFTYIESYKEQDESEWVHKKAFILKAPARPGIYACTFECTDKEGDIALVSMNVEVVGVLQPIGSGYKLMPVGQAQPAQQIKPVQTAKGTMRSTTSSKIEMSRDSAIFWCGFIVGILVATICFAAGASSATK